MILASGTGDDRVAVEQIKKALAKIGVAPVLLANQKTQPKRWSKHRANRSYMVSFWDNTRITIFCIKYMLVIVMDPNLVSAGLFALGGAIGFTKKGSVASL
jgi:hypothetical protein